MNAPHVSQVGDRRAAWLNIAAVGYVVLWVLEGAARKWIPGTGELLYFARDAFMVTAILLALLSARRATIPTPLILAVMLFFTVVGLQVVMLPTPALVAAIGVKSYLAPLLLATFAIITRHQLHWSHLVRCVLYLAPVQLVIAVLQISSPRDAPINLEVSGDEANFVQSGIVRATGTFSSPSGLTVYLLMAFALSLAALLAREKVMRTATTVVLLTTVASTVILSGSRGTIFGCAVVATALLWKSFATDGRAVFRVVGSTVLLAVLAVVIASVAAPAVFDALINRFLVAAASEDTSQRILATALALGDVHAITPLGSGAGSHSQAGIAVGSTFGWVEVEGDRWTDELGILGVMMNLGRLVFAGTLIVAILTHAKDKSPFWIASAAALIVMLLTGTMTTNPSTQGAFSLTTALLILMQADSSHSVAVSRPARVHQDAALALKNH